MERQRIEAYNNYMSDSLLLINTYLTRGEVEIPRYADMFTDHQPVEQETVEQIYSRFSELRRAT